MKACVHRRRDENLTGFGLKLYSGVVLLLTTLRQEPMLPDNQETHLTEDEWARVYTYRMRANQYYPSGNSLHNYVGGICHHGESIYLNSSFLSRDFPQASGRVLRNHKEFTFQAMANRLER